jgi:protein-S-isoprenylcysteine O-methyltransferase Ste14
VALLLVGGVLRIWPLFVLRARFGAEYDAYRQRTLRLIPGLH